MNYSPESPDIWQDPRLGERLYPRPAEMFIIIIMTKIILALCLFFLTACAASETGMDRKDLPFLTYTRSGGFAGISETWEMYADGRLIPREGTARTAETKAALALLEQLRVADLPNLARKTPAGQNCADCFIVELVFRDGSEEIRLTVTPESPDALPDAVAVVQAV